MCISEHLILFCKVFGLVQYCLQYMHFLVYFTLLIQQGSSSFH